MQIEKQRRSKRRQELRGYSPSRRRSVSGEIFGLERRRSQRRDKDRRELFRRAGDRLEDSPADSFS